MTTTVYIIYRPSRSIKDTPGSIFVRLTCRRRSRTITVAKGIFANEWNNKKQCVVFPEDNPQRTAQLKAIAKNVSAQYGIIIDIIEHHEQQGYYTVDDIVNKYMMTTENGTLLSYAQKLAGELENNQQKRTAEAYRTCAAGLVTFTGNRKFKLSEINQTVIKAFETDMKRRGKSPNTVSYYMRNLRAIYNKAVNDKRIREKNPKPFAGVFTGFHKTTKRSMTAAELERFFSLDLKGKINQLPAGSKEHLKYTELYKAWRLFFFCFYAQGLCFVDLSYLKKENIRGGILSYYRRKTGQLIEVRVTDDMLYLIESFRDETSGSEYLFPIITDPRKDDRKQYSSGMRTQNRKLEELSKLAGLGRKVTTHVVRHTYATLLKRNHVAMSVISQTLGHSTEKTTQTYLDSLDRNVIDQANERVTAPYHIVQGKGVEAEHDYGKKIVDLLQSHIGDNDKAQIFYPLLQGLFRIMEVGM